MKEQENSEGKMDLFRNRKDWIIMGLALLALAFLIPPLVDSTIYEKWFGENIESTAPVVAELSSLGRDTRHKSSVSTVWKAAQEGQKIRAGDAIFAGNGSMPSIKFSEGGELTLKENSLVVFDPKEMVPELRFGSIDLKVEGKMKVLLQGQVYEIEGFGTEVQLSPGENGQPPEIKSSKPIVVKPRGKTAFTVLPKKKPSTSSASQLAPLKVEDPVAVQLKPAQEAPPDAEAEISSYDYIYTVEDFYEASKTGQLWKKDGEPTFAATAVTLPVPPEVAGKPIEVQQSADESFQKFKSYQVKGSSFDLTQVSFGLNYWRYTADERKTWSKAQKFEVKPRAYKAEAEIKLDRETKMLDGKEVKFTASLAATKKMAGYLVEMSSAEDFPKGRTTVSFTSSNSKELRFNHPATRYLRIRGVTKKKELTELSPVVRLQVLLPEQIESPQVLAPAPLAALDQPFKLQWTAKEKTSYEVEVRNEFNDVVEKKTVTGSEFSWQPRKKGEYTYKITARDGIGRKSAPVGGKLTVVNRLPTLAAAPKSDRAPAQSPTEVGTSSLLLDSTIPPYLNRNFVASKVELELSTNRVQSSEQADQQSVAPIIAGLALRTHTWLTAKVGLEGSAKSKVFGFNETGQRTSILQLEARAHYRWFVNWNPFPSFNRSQISAFGGYEMFRSSGNPHFAPKYDLFKLGLNTEFPLWEKWDTGGEFVYGIGADKSRKYEISGHIHYYLQKAWSLGVGYRVHLFDAGSEASAGSLGLPYREGYGEGYSVLRWHY
jgi:hypothetical protein